MRFKTYALLLALYAVGISSPLAAAACWNAPAAFEAAMPQSTTYDHPVGEFVAYSLDTGALDNPSDTLRLVYHELIAVPKAASIRLYFGKVALEKGSFVRLQSILDGEEQRLDAEQMEMWSNSSAYFNGSTILLEVYAGAHTRGNRLAIDKVWVQISSEADITWICGSDDRVPSNEEWTGRLMPVGCTASVWTRGSCLVSAGHCFSTGLVIQFRVPPSNPDCSLRHPGVEDQFPITSWQYFSGGVGNDWMVMTCGTNNLGQKPFQRYGQLRRFTNIPANVGDAVTIWGYGVDDECTRSQTQQTHTDQIIERGSNYYAYNVDTRGGNSGSAVIKANRIIAIHTHNSGGRCPNLGTRADNSNFVSARRSLCPCTGDVDGNALVDDVDVAAVLTAFGRTGQNLPEDLNRDGVVNDADLSLVLINFGNEC